MTTILAALAVILTLALIATRKPRRTKPDSRDCAPYTRHEREDAWRVQFMLAQDVDYLATACRGATAKRRMLVEQRNRAALSFLPPYMPATVHAIEHYGVGPRTRREIAVRPLTSFQPKPKTVVVRRRPKLALAR
jgi:hypothetical protein